MCQPPSGEFNKPESASRAVGHVLLDDSQRLLELFGRTELDDLGSGVEERKMNGRNVVGLDGLDDDVAIGAAVLQSSFEHHAPMRALAAVVRQALEECGQIGIGGVGLESDGVAIEF